MPVSYGTYIETELLVRKTQGAVVVTRRVCFEFQHTELARSRGKVIGCPDKRIAKDLLLLPQCLVATKTTKQFRLFSPLS